VQVVQFVNDERYARFTRIVFDTAPTGHTLRFLAVPEFVDVSLGKIIKLRKKLGGAGGAIRSLFGQGEQQDEAVQKLQEMQSNIRMVS
jgi:arsenite-transporting ATPase